MSKRTRAAGLLAALVLAAGLTACGDDDDPAVGEASGSASDAESGAEGDLATYCEKTAAIETIGEPEVDFETASEDEVAAAVKSFVEEKMQPLAADIDASAPDEIREEIDVLVAAVDELAETGDFETAFGSPEVEEAGNTTHAFDLEQCGWNVVDVTATNYAFAGIDAELAPGVASFELTNEGTELHEIVVLRKNDDTTESWDELLMLPEEEGMQKAAFVGAAFAAPGEEGEYAIADLTAGEYLAVCFIPVGSVSEDAPAGGPPHFTQGMKTEFTVS